MHPSQVYRFHWEGIEIEATYVPHSWGGVIAHLEIETIQPPRASLPITETGYLSHYHACGTVEASGGDVVAQVISWLDEAATNPDWQKHMRKSRQGELF